MLPKLLVHNLVLVLLQVAVGRDTRGKPQGLTNCESCRNNRWKHDWEHTRVIGDCTYPYDEPFAPECEAYVKRLPKAAVGHTFEAGKCRHAEADAHQLQAPSRRAHGEPHTPVPPAASDPTAGMAPTRDGRELGQEAEEAVQRADADAVARSS